eukprot:CAMPEP_0198149196 /NCGR_PEP_ID=MMETSP1443-20131203/45348_1 /TAXON_ID=186043 /ORGANISM="Entomoneis sp., Strain CCMP2396" /LENGTH=442 /DNA_ID=CAMNT_0043814149 /DNA_START=115 /DNA_END=1439 /DNA_ORIENTATION=+
MRQRRVALGGHWLLLITLFLTAMMISSVHSQEQEEAVSSSDEPEQEQIPEPEPVVPAKKEAEPEPETKKESASGDGPGKTSKPRAELLEDSGFDASSTNWGSYYDPQNIFCGKYDCYKILGFDYDLFGKSPPDTKIITKRYRKLGREWHPDKSKHKDAKERFVKIVRAYEVLTDAKVRAEYDAMRFDQEKYYAKYGTSVLWNYAPQTDFTIVLIIIFFLANVFSWFSQKHRWRMVADRLTKAAVEDWAPAQGGSPESKDLRQRALDVLNEDMASSESETPAAPATTTATKTNSKKQKGGGSSNNGIKLTSREKKQKEEEALWPVVKALVNEMKDFGSGFHQPTWRDLLFVTLAKMPFTLGLGLLWNAKYYLRRLQKLELNDEETQVLTQRAVGPVVWDSYGDDEEQIQALIKRKLWIPANRTEWDEEQAFKNMSSAEQKYHT